MFSTIAYGTRANSRGDAATLVTVVPLAEPSRQKIGNFLSPTGRSLLIAVGRGPSRVVSRWLAKAAEKKC